MSKVQDKKPQDKKRAKKQEYFKKQQKLIFALH